MLVVTGAAGFIGSCMASKLNKEDFSELVLVDDFNRPVKERNTRDKQFAAMIDRSLFFQFMEENREEIEFVFHLGARTDTTEMDQAVFDRLNLNYSKEVWRFCSEYGIPLIYASSAATYGNGEHGYSDNHSGVHLLKPLNPYGASKQDFDLWALEQERTPPFWAGLKFFNVFGPNEYHKRRMASVVFHAYHQISETGRLRLFRSHKPEYEDGGQLRDFIYVEDVVEVMWFLMQNNAENGIYNLGTGKARTFLDLGKAVFRAMSREAQIEFIDTPADIRDRYQYYTQAEMGKLRKAGFKPAFRELEAAIDEYVKRYLVPDIVY